MPKATPLINNFNAGEISPKIDARSDITKYFSGCLTLENFIPLVEGGAIRIPGTYFVAEVKNSGIARLMPFHFSTEQAYVLECGEEYIRFYKDSGRIGQDISGIENNGAGLIRVSVASIHGLVTGDTVYIFDVLGTTEANGFWIVTFISPTIFDLQDSTFVHTYISGGTWVAEIETPYQEKELFNLKTTQSADVLYNFHPTYPIGKLTRTGHTTWIYTPITPEPFDETKMYPSCGTFFEQRLGLAGMINEPQKIYLSGVADFENFVEDPEDASSAKSFLLVSERVDRIRWLLGQEVLAIGTVGGVWKFELDENSDPDAKKQITYGVKDIEPEMVADAILWVTRSGKVLRQFVYDLMKEKWIAPDMTRVARHITRGLTKALSGIVDMDFQMEPQPILWCVRADGQLLGLTYELQEEVYAWFRVVTDGEFESVAVIHEDDNEDQVWVIVKREIIINGVPTTKRYIEYFKPQEFFSEIKDCFFVHSGLTYDGGSEVEITDITNDDPAVVTAPDHEFLKDDKVRIKDVQGMTKVNQGLYQAYTVDNVDGDTFELSGVDSSVYDPWATSTSYEIGDFVTQDENFYQCLIAHTSGVFETDLAAGKWEVTTGWGVYTGGGTAQKVTNSLSHLDHLKGKEIDVLIDGAVHSPRLTVSSGGTVTLLWYGNKIHAGLPYTSILEPMKIHITTPAGTSRGKKQKITEIVACFYETMCGKYGPDRNNLMELPFGTGTQPELVTDDFSVPFDGDWTEKSTLCIVQDKPLPMTVLAIVPEVNLSER